VQLHRSTALLRRGALFASFPVGCIVQGGDHHQQVAALGLARGKPDAAGAITLPRFIVHRCVSWSSVDRRNQLTGHAPEWTRPT
jgi:hypothetical protein